MTQTETSETNCGEPGEIKTLKSRERRVRWRGRKSEVGISEREVEEKNRAEVARKSAVSLSETPTWLGTQRKRTVF